VRYLSDEWIDALDRSVQASSSEVRPDPPVVIQQTVTGVASGDVAYRIVLGPDGCRVLAGPGSAPTLSLVTDAECAARTARGEVAALQFVLDGRIRIEGDIARLAEITEALAQLEGALSAVRSRTEW
jgi:hypothetical protein